MRSKWNKNCGGLSYIFLTHFKKNLSFFFFLPWDKMDDTHEHEKDSFEPLKQEFYEGKHLTAPVKEIQVCFPLKKKFDTTC